MGFVACFLGFTFQEARKSLVPPPTHTLPLCFYDDGTAWSTNSKVDCKGNRVEPKSFTPCLISPSKMLFDFLSQVV